MKYQIFFSVVTLCLFLFGCATKNQGVLQRNISQAHNFREHCQTAGITSAEITKADSLLKSSLAAKEAQQFEDAEWQSDLATTYYKIGILNFELSVSKNNVEQLKTELASDQEKLNGLLEVYDEIKSLRKQ